MATTLKNARKQKGISGSELAKAVGVNKSTISRLENGLRAPMYDTAQRIEKVLGCTIRYSKKAA